MPIDTLPPPPPAIIITGMATFYSPGVFEVVYANRRMWGQVPSYDDYWGFAAMLAPGMIGKSITVRNLETGEAIGPLLVVDCAAWWDLESLHERNIVVEVDWPLAVRWHMDAPLPVAVEVLSE